MQKHFPPWPFLFTTSILQFSAQFVKKKFFRHFAIITTNLDLPIFVIFPLEPKWIQGGFLFVRPNLIGLWRQTVVELKANLKKYEFENDQKYIQLINDQDILTRLVKTRKINVTWLDLGLFVNGLWYYQLYRRPPWRNGA